MVKKIIEEHGGTLSLEKRTGPYGGPESHISGANGGHHASPLLPHGKPELETP